MNHYKIKYSTMGRKGFLFKKPEICFSIRVVSCNNANEAEKDFNNWCKSNQIKALTYEIKEM